MGFDINAARARVSSFDPISRIRSRVSKLDRTIVEVVRSAIDNLPKYEPKSHSVLFPDGAAPLENRFYSKGRELVSSINAARARVSSFDPYSRLRSGVSELDSKGQELVSSINAARARVSSLDILSRLRSGLSELDANIAGPARSAIANLLNEESKNHPIVLPGRAAPLENRFYSHGGFMGLATELILDPNWRGVLRFSESGVYYRCSKILEKNGINIHSMPEEIVSPKCIEEIMLALENTATLSAFGCIRAAASEEYKQEDKPIIEWDIWIDGGGSNSIEGSRIIHGNRRSVVLGRIKGLGRHLLYTANEITNVHEGRNPAQWKASFQKAIYMFEKNRAAEEIDLESKEYEQVDLKKYVSSFFLEIKSTYSTSEDVSDFVSTLRRELSLEITHIASFSQSQVSVDIDGVTPIYFRHGVWDLPKYKKGNVKATMFNGSDLIHIDEESGGYSINEDKLAALHSFRNEHPDCSLGFYVQETDINPLAADLLIKLANSETELFSLGFAYGNISATTTNRWTVGYGGGCQAAINRIKSVKAKKLSPLCI